MKNFFSLLILLTSHSVMSHDKLTIEETLQNIKLDKSNEEVALRTSFQRDAVHYLYSRLVNKAGIEVKSSEVSKSVNEEYRFVFQSFIKTSDNQICQLDVTPTFCDDYGCENVPMRSGILGELSCTDQITKESFDPIKMKIIYNGYPPLDREYLNDSDNWVVYE